MQNITQELNSAYRRDKCRIRANFNAAADGYDAIAELQRTVAERLLEQLQLIRIKPAVILDLGSGTGYLGRKLDALFPKSRIVQLDCALNMLCRARRPRGRFFAGFPQRFFARLYSAFPPRHAFICADAEALPLAECSVDFIASNLMLQWIDEPQRLLAECARTLQPGGLFLFSSFGPDTLRELRQSWQAVDARVHVNAFIDMHDLGQSLLSAGFAEPVLHAERFTLLYDDVYALMRELKGLGAGNVNQGRRKTLTTAAMLRRLAMAYDDNFRGAGAPGRSRLPATFEVVSGHAWLPLQPRVRAGDGTVRLPVTAIGRRKRA